MQVRIKACDLLQELINDPTDKSIQLKDLNSIIGILVDFLSENNPKVKEHSEEILKLILTNKKLDFNEGLTAILTKGSKMNKAVTRYNHWKLNFLIYILEEQFENSDASKTDHKKSNFPTSLFLEFVDKSILKREKALNRSMREKVEKAFIIAYQQSNYETIKDYTGSLDHLSISNLVKHIPELKPPTPVKEDPEESNRKMAEETTKRIIQLRKDKLK